MPEQVIAEFTRSFQPGTWLVDSIPIRKPLPPVKIIAIIYFIPDQSNSFLHGSHWLASRNMRSFIGNCWKGWHQTLWNMSKETW